MLSIKPPFAEAIRHGEKKYEFRRNIFSRRVDVVVVYVTAPVSRVIGEFDIKRIINAPLPNLWKQTRYYAGIDRKFFLSYFEGRDNGYAIEIGDFRTYLKPFCPIKGLGKKPPQSFVYLDSVGGTGLQNFKHLTA